MELELPAFRLRHIQDVIDESQQKLRGRRYLLETAHRLRRILLLSRNPRHSDDSVHRCADIVTDTGQKFRLCRIRFIRLPHSNSQLLVLLRNDL